MNKKVNSFSHFTLFIIVMTHNSPVNFKLTHFLLCIKESCQNPNFETFKCSGENLVNSSCHFWKHKSIFLQILQQSSVLSNIAPLYFLSIKMIHFDQKQSIKVQIFETFECLGQNSLKFLMSILKRQVNSLSNFSSFSSAITSNSSVNF